MKGAKDMTEKEVIDAIEYMLEVRNNTIIRILEETTDIVENRHTGIATMRDEMKKMNLPEPEFENLRGTFKVTFRKEKQEIIAQIMR